jgi:hypothetical protein
VQRVVLEDKRRNIEIRVHALNHEENDDLEIYSVYSHGNDSIWIKPCVNGNVIPMELDTGSSVSVISEADYVKYFKGEKLEKSLLVLKTYSGEKLHSLGVMRVQLSISDYIFCIIVLSILRRFRGI